MTVHFPLSKTAKKWGLLVPFLGVPDSWYDLKWISQGRKFFGELGLLLRQALFGGRPLDARRGEIHRSFGTLVEYVLNHRQESTCRASSAS